MSKLRPPNELIFTEVHTQAEQWRMWEQEMRLYIQLALIVGQIRAKKQPNRSLCDTSTKFGTNIRYGIPF